MSTLQEFKNITDNLTGIQKLVIVARDGTILLHSGCLLYTSPSPRDS